jgi:hypothetical protein
MGFKLGKVLGQLATGNITGAAKTGLSSIVKASKKGGGTSTQGSTFMVPTQGGTNLAAAQARLGPGACGVEFDRGRFRTLHPNKSTYVTRGGGTSRWPKSLMVHERGTACVPRRKLNAGNGRAATRAVRRLVAFYKLSQRVAKQLRKAASAAHLRGGRRGQRALPRGGVEVVNVE